MKSLLDCLLEANSVLHCRLHTKIALPGFRSRSNQKYIVDFRAAYLKAALIILQRVLEKLV